MTPEEDVFLDALRLIAIDYDHCFCNTHACTLFLTVNGQTIVTIIIGCYRVHHDNQCTAHVSDVFVLYYYACSMHVLYTVYIEYFYNEVYVMIVHCIVHFIH